MDKAKKADTKEREPFFIRTVAEQEEEAGEHGVRVQKDPEQSQRRRH